MAMKNGRELKSGSWKCSSWLKTCFCVRDREKDFNLISSAHTGIQIQEKLTSMRQDLLLSCNRYLKEYGKHDTNQNDLENNILVLVCHNFNRLNSGYIWADNINYVSIMLTIQKQTWQLTLPQWWIVQYFGSKTENRHSLVYDMSPWMKSQLPRKYCD